MTCRYKVADQCLTSNWTQTADWEKHHFQQEGTKCALPGFSPISAPNFPLTWWGLEITQNNWSNEKKPTLGSQTRMNGFKQSLKQKERLTDSTCILSKMNHWQHEAHVVTFHSQIAQRLPYGTCAEEIWTIHSSHKCLLKYIDMSKPTAGNRCM